MSLFLVDVEADGPCPGLYSVISVGIVKYGEGATPEFYGRFAPISQRWVPGALAVSGHTREEHLSFPAPEVETARMVEWLSANSNKQPVFVSDNPAFDWQFINYYCHKFLGENPFGYSARRIGDFYAGLKRDFFASGDWKNLRRTKHTHHPVDDARGNCEALRALLTMTDT